MPTREDNQRTTGVFPIRLVPVPVPVLIVVVVPIAVAMPMSMSMSISTTTAGIPRNNTRSRRSRRGSLLPLPPLGNGINPPHYTPDKPSFQILIALLLPGTPVRLAESWAPDTCATDLAYLAAWAPSALAQTSHLVDVREEVAVEHAVCEREEGLLVHVGGENGSQDGAQLEERRRPACGAG